MLDSLHERRRGHRLAKQRGRPRRSSLRLRAKCTFAEAVCIFVCAWMRFLLCRLLRSSTVRFESRSAGRARSNAFAMPRRWNLLLSSFLRLLLGVELQKKWRPVMLQFSITTTKEKQILFWADYLLNIYLFYFYASHLISTFKTKGYPAMSVLS